MEILEVKTLIKNIQIKLSKCVKNLLLLVLENNEILIRYCDLSSNFSIKIITFFFKQNLSVTDIETDENGVWLFVLCRDNSVHVLPAMFLVDKSVPFECIFNPTEITSYLIPTNGYLNIKDASEKSSRRMSECLKDDYTQIQMKPSMSSVFSVKKVNELATNSVYTKFYCDTMDTTENSSNSPTHQQPITEVHSPTSKLSDSQTPMSLDGCYPNCCCFWQTQTNENRLIIAYDAAICVVALRASSCELIGITAIERGLIEKMVICRDNSLETITLMINTSIQEQWKLLLEQKSIGYVFPGENNLPSKLSFAKMNKSKSTDTADSSQNDNDWQFVMQIQSQATDEADISIHEAASNNNNNIELPEQQYQEMVLEDPALTANDKDKFVPAAKARLFERFETLRDLGAKKIGTLKLKLVESRMRAKEKEKLREQPANLAILEAPGTVPEILTTPHGPFFILQYFLNKYFLSALHHYSNTLSVHGLDISLIPLFLYKIPDGCKDILLTENLMFFTKSSVVTTPKEETPPSVSAADEEAKDVIDVEDDDDGESVSTLIDTPSSDSKAFLNIVGVVSSALAKSRIGDDCEFNEKALIGLFEFPDEHIIDIYRHSAVLEPEEVVEPIQTEHKTNLVSYMEQHKHLKKPRNFDKSDSEVLQNSFPAIRFETCVVVTNKGVYSIDLKDRPHILFLEMADKEMWGECECFCKTFGLSLAQCIEFAGDIFLKKKKITQALMTYNIGRIPPMKTALKLAMFNEVTALLHLSANALNNTHLINSKFPMSVHIKSLLETAGLRFLKYDTILMGLHKKSLLPSNEAQLCSDFSYEVDRGSNDFQLSNSSQFHLSNLMFLALCERCIKDRNYMPLMNFIATNSKYHTSLSSIILSQSGLYASALLLCKVSGACLDVFSGLVASDHLLSMKPEVNVFLYNLSDEMFRESITYLQNYSIEYFDTIRQHIDKLDLHVVRQLEQQLNPFHPVYKPIMCRINSEFSSTSQNKKFMDFFKSFIQTYITVLLQLQIITSHQDNFMNALDNFLVNYDQDRSAIQVKHYSPMSAGFSHASCVVNHTAYIWGWNGVNCALNRTINQSDLLESASAPAAIEFLNEINVKVYAVKCGKSHTLFLTNNGLYAMGGNHLGQLGIGKALNQTTVPFLVRKFDGKNITHIDAGHYHNAVVADDRLYVWGWGVFGQLGLGTIDDQFEPRINTFFNDKTVTQISLGYAHTLVLCRDTDDSTGSLLYIFGSNHYGQLGVGQTLEPELTNDTKDSTPQFHRKTFVKSLVPIKVKLSEPIRLINTGYFTNLAVSQSNKLYTWGISPQALRLSSQARKRAKAVQKVDESVPPQQRQTTSDEIKTEAELGKFEEVNIEVIKEELNQETSELEAKAGVSNPEIIITLAENKVETEVLTTEVSEVVKPVTVLQEQTDHLFPTLVDTSGVSGEISNISTGLYHFALIDSQGKLYTWGKNLQRQLGREGSRNEVLVPTILESFADVSHVECGADFTLVLYGNSLVKSFGNNNNGQCGKEVNNDKTNFANKFIRLRGNSKKLVRIPDGNQCIETPVEVILPQTTPAEPLRYMKSFPEFSASFVNRSEYGKQRTILSNGTIESNINEYTTSDEDRSLEDYSLRHGAKVKTINGYNLTSETTTNPSDYIHYCLYIFHGLYDQHNIGNLSNNHLTEYKIRLLMLNYNYIDAFKLCLQSGNLDASKSIRLFEYFTKDGQIVPMHEENLKFFIYEILLHFVDNHLNVADIEEFFMANIDYYLVQLAFVLFFSNNNNSGDLEKNTFEKFRNVFADTELENENLSKIDRIDVIFKQISINFNVFVCEQLINYAKTI